MEFGEKPEDTITSENIKVGMKIVITAGGTEEKIDEVRKITNMSTGALGAKIAEEIIIKWNNINWNNLTNEDMIFYICNKNSIKPSFPAHMKSYITIIETTDTDSVELNLNNVLKNNKIDCVIHGMAISDYKVDGVFTIEYFRGDISHFSSVDTSSKMKSDNDEIYLKLVKTPKIIDSIKEISPKTRLISFKLMNDVSEEQLLETARNQLKRTNSSLVVANDLKNIKAGNHRALMVNKNSFDIVESKQEIAKFLVNSLYLN